MQSLNLNIVVCLNCLALPYIYMLATIIFFFSFLLILNMCLSCDGCAHARESNGMVDFRVLAHQVNQGVPIQPIAFDHNVAMMLSLILWLRLL